MNMPLSHNVGISYIDHISPLRSVKTHVQSRTPCQTNKMMTVNMDKETVSLRLQLISCMPIKDKVNNYWRSLYESRNRNQSWRNAQRFINPTYPSTKHEQDTLHKCGQQSEPRKNINLGLYL